MVELASESLEVPRLLAMAYTVVEYQGTRLEAFLKKVKELPLEERRHDPDGDEEPFSGWDPASCVGGESPSGDNAMDMGMIHEVLAPGVENPDAADLCAEMFRILCELGEGFGDRTEEKIVQDLAVHGDQGVEFGGEGEDDMEVLNGQEVLRAGLDPFFFP
jgi:hypothetical protein